jgi:predicted DNA binding CopG/RHH family protein
MTGQCDCGCASIRLLLGPTKPTALNGLQKGQREDRRLNIRISTKDLEAIQKRALEEGLPYQTLIASLLHKYASGRLREA